MLSRRAFCTGAAGIALPAALAQVIEFENHGVKYQTLTRNGVTVMFAPLPAHVREYAILQAAVSNGAKSSYMIRPEDFVYHKNDGAEIRAVPARVVVSMLIEKGGRNDVIKLVSAYENTLYGISRMRSSNGYEARRLAALAEVSNTKLKAAAAAAAIAFVQTKLLGGASTDGAVFFPTDGKMLGFGHIVVRTNTDIFNFTTD